MYNLHAFPHTLELMEHVSSVKVCGSISFADYLTLSHI